MTFQICRKNGSPSGLLCFSQRSLNFSRHPFEVGLRSFSFRSKEGQRGLGRVYAAERDATFDSDYNDD